MSRQHPDSPDSSPPPKPVDAAADLRAACREICRQPLYWLLLAIPVAVGLEFASEGGLWVFIVSGLAIVPLAGLMGRATENLAETMGAGAGGLLNATFGNAAELIIALIALWKGPKMYDLVKASITGSIRRCSRRCATASRNAPTPGSTSLGARAICSGRVTISAEAPITSKPFWTLRRLPMP